MLPLRFAVRYLFARKSYNVINMISGIGVAGMAIGTASLVIILSVFNGFNRLVSDSLGNARADVVVRPAAGKVFSPDTSFWEGVRADERVVSLSEVLEEQVFLSYEGKQSVVNARGVDEVYEEEMGLNLRNGDIRLAAVSSDLAWSLGINPKFLSPIQIWYPDRTGYISPSNPAASLHTAEIHAAKVMDIPHTTDSGADGTMIIPIGVMRSLTGYYKEVSAVEIRFSAGLSPRAARAFRRELGKQLGDAFIVQDRYMQDESLYKMMRYEKAAIFLILIFIVIIISLNIFGSLSMLIIEKQEDIATLHAMGADERLIRRVFVLEGWMISLLGMAVGVVLGVGLALLQQHFGLIKMPGNFVVDAYPVVLRLGDVLLSAAGVALIGLLVALAPATRLRS